MRRKAFSMALVVVLLFIVYGCVSVEGPTIQASPGFVPKKVYGYSYDKMWDKALSSLKKEKIMLASINKESGIIATDYIQGQTLDYAALSTVDYRYKYQITFEKINTSKTQVEITCRLEKREMLKGGSAREAVEQLKPYQDVTFKEKEQAKILEYWLYEQIEKSL
ncbi:MAG: hypothetical protein AABZ25_04990 [Nitrospirota bacterium]